MNGAPIENADDLTADWLTANLGGSRVIDFSTERIGTGQMSECYRVALSYAEGAGPASVVLKVAASNPVSRHTGQALGLYQREVRFYSDIAPRLGGPIAHCYHAAHEPDTGVFSLLLDDAAPAEVGDELRGATVPEARLALSRLGQLHAPLLGNATLAEAAWLNRDNPVTGAVFGQLYAGFIDRYGQNITAEQRMVCQRLADSFDGYLAQESAPERVKGLVHGDYRLDNMLFGRPGSLRDLTVVDWQTVTSGPPMTDVAYFLGCALPVAERRAHDDELLRAYHRSLGSDPALSIEQVRDGVRRQSFFGVMMAIVSSMLVARTERGDRMFLTMLDRHSRHVLDTDALQILPVTARGSAPQPDSADESAHTPGAEPLWNESWYWDFIDPEQRVGGWIRLGLLPNQNVAWINALICGPDMPTVAMLDFEVPIPTEPNAVTADGIELRHRATVPLRDYRVAVSGPAQVHDDPATLLTGGTGRPTELAMDLRWVSSGTPYAYRIATRYEIPCAVSGTITADGHTYELTAVPGQRDHSHGIRDWWSMDWVWSALHLDDGTHLHGVDLRIPGTTPISVGYIESPAAPVVETTSVTAETIFAANELPASATLTMHPGPIALAIDIRGHAPVRLVSPEGRVSQFPRAWASVRTADGRRGVGWFEWNRNPAAD